MTRNRFRGMNFITSFINQRSANEIRILICHYTLLPVIL